MFKMWQIRGNNIKFILPHCSKDVYKHSFLPIALRGWNALTQSSVEATSSDLFKASLPSVHTNVALNCFYHAPSGSFCCFFILNVRFSLFSVFCPSHLIISIDGSWLMEPKWIFITTSVLRHAVFPKYVTNISFGDRSTNIFCIKTLATYNNWRHNFQWKISPAWKNRLEDIWKRLKYMQYDKKTTFVQ